MQTATLDPLDDVAPLVEMALAAEARLRPHLINPPASPADDVPHLNRVTLILGRLISLRKSLRALRDGDPAPPRAAKPRPPSRPLLGADDLVDPVSNHESIAARLAAAHRLIDTLGDPAPAPAPEPGPSAADEVPPPVLPADREPASPQPDALAIVVNSPAQSEANAKKFDRALRKLAAEARRLPPNAIPSSPFGLADLHPCPGPIKLSPALLKNLRRSSRLSDTS